MAHRVIPCLDVKDGRVVKGVRFQDLSDRGDPAELAAAYERQGADEIVVLDVSATAEGRAARLGTVRRVREVLSIPLTVGGGVRTAEDAAALLGAGADKISVNTAAVRDPEVLEKIAARFGCQCCVLALDAARHPNTNRPAVGEVSVGERSEAAGQIEWEVMIESGKTPTGKDPVAWAEEAVRRGAGEILLTSWDRDGTRSGYDLALTAAVAGAVNVPVIASGGAASPADLAAALRAGAQAVLAASIFHDGQCTVDEVKRFLSRLGIVVRLPT